MYFMSLILDNFQALVVHHADMAALAGRKVGASGVPVLSEPPLEEVVNAQTA
jgi:hypothetical protein